MKIVLTVFLVLAMVTAGHGMVFSPGSPRQIRHQGALLGGDLPHPGRGRAGPANALSEAADAAQSRQSLFPGIVESPCV